MSTTALPTTPTTPSYGSGVGNRRKGPKSLPKLPASAFSAPNSAISDNFPLAPSPSTLHPAGISDAQVNRSNLKQWESATGDLVSKSQGVVITLAQGESASEDVLKATSAKVLGVSLPFNLDDPSVPAPPSLSVPTSLWTIIKEVSPENHATLGSALAHGRPIDLQIKLNISEESASERLQDWLAKATADLNDTPPIILSNVLPPPHDLSLPLVKLINHPTYQAYQAQIAALSLFPRTFVKFTPPEWSESVPSGDSEEALKQKREWKRRIKMFLGPAIEAFGYERILFGSSGVSSQSTSASAWYDLARESFAEMNTEQEVMDAIFGLNAAKVYGA